jgi:hypothetical protein
LETLFGAQTDFNRFMDGHQPNSQAHSRNTNPTQADIHKCSMTEAGIGTPKLHMLYLVALWRLPIKIFRKNYWDIRAERALNADNIMAKEFGPGVVLLVAELYRGYRCGMGKAEKGKPGVPPSWSVPDSVRPSATACYIFIGMLPAGGKFLK